MVTNVFILQIFNYFKCGRVLIAIIFTAFALEHIYSFCIYFMNKGLLILVFIPQRV